VESFNKNSIHERKPRLMLGLLLRESTVRETESQSINMKEVSE